MSYSTAPVFLLILCVASGALAGTAVSSSLRPGAFAHCGWGNCGPGMHHKFKEFMYINIPVEIGTDSPFMPSTSTFKCLPDTHSGSHWVSVIVGSTVSSVSDYIPVPSFLGGAADSVRVQTYIVCNGERFVVSLVQNASSRLYAWGYNHFFSPIIPAGTQSAESFFDKNEETGRYLRDVRVGTLPQWGDWSREDGRLQVDYRVTSSPHKAMKSPPADWFTGPRVWAGRSNDGDAYVSELSEVERSTPKSVKVSLFKAEFLKPYLETMMGVKAVPDIRGQSEFAFHIEDITCTFGHPVDADIW